MTPYRFEEANGIIKFRYKYSKLKEFIKRGREYGDCGYVLISRKDNILTYLVFGTIENPSKEPKYISLIHNPLFDGEIISDEERCIETKETIFSDISNYKMYFIDLNKE